MAKKSGLRCIERIQYSRIRTDKRISEHTRIIALSYAALMAAHATGTTEEECSKALTEGRKITETFENEDMRITISWIREVEA